MKTSTVRHDHDSLLPTSIERSSFETHLPGREQARSLTLSLHRLSPRLSTLKPRPHAAILSGNAVRSKMYPTHQTTPTTCPRKQISLPQPSPKKSRRQSARSDYCNWGTRPRRLRNRTRDRSTGSERRKLVTPYLKSMFDRPVLSFHFMSSYPIATVPHSIRSISFISSSEPTHPLTILHTEDFMRGLSIRCIMSLSSSHRIALHRISFQFISHPPFVLPLRSVFTPSTFNPGTATPPHTRHSHRTHRAPRRPPRAKSPG